MILAWSGNIFAAQKIYPDIHGVQYVRNYDGDTVTVNICNYPEVIGKEISIRLHNVDTPEIRGKCGNEKMLAKRIKKVVADILSNAKEIYLTKVKRDKYFRINADMMVDGVSLSWYIRQFPYVYDYDGSTKQDYWCTETEEK